MSAACKGEDGSPFIFGGLCGFEDVGGCSAGGKCPEDVSFFDEGFDLSAEDFFESVVVADGGEDGGVGCECDGGQSFALSAETSDEFCGGVLGVGG